MNVLYAQTKKLLRFHFVAFGVVVAMAAAAVLFYSPREPRAPAVPLAQGRQVYSVVSGGTGPQITQIVINPFDPKIGEMQTMEMTVRYKEPVTRAIVLLTTDRAETPYNFFPAGESEYGGRLYRASWETADTHERVYGATVTVESGSASSSVELTLR